MIILAPEAYLPIREVGVRFHAAADGVAAADRVFALLDAPGPASGPRRAVPDLRCGGSLRIAGASIAHPGREGFAPEAADLVVQPGEVVAITGPSGAGKTSLLAAVLGTTELARGTITVSGGGTEVDRHQLDLDAWHGTLAWVDQTPYLFSGTIADNVRLAAPSATDAEVRHVLDAVALGHLELGRSVGEAGRALSSGERRRVAVARALLRDAPLVLLDEPTAGLDDAAEALVLAAVRRLAERSAVLMAAHRPAAIAAADRVVALAPSPPTAPLPSEGAALTARAAP